VFYLSVISLFVYSRVSFICN